MRNNVKTYLTVILLTLLSACDVAILRDDLSYGYDYGTSQSIGGSLASFTISGNYLYTISQGQLLSYDISAPKNAITVSQAYVKDASGYPLNNLETIFPYEDYLCLGATDGMYIIDVSDPAEPQYVSQYAHVNSCDPVVVQDSLAYVTMRDGNQCGQSVNELHVIDISEVYAPKALATYTMENPYGLGIDGDILFICDNDKLKVFDANDPENISLVEVFDGLSATDVIPFDTVLIVLGNGELNQFSYTPGDTADQGSLSLLSTIAKQ